MQVFRAFLHPAAGGRERVLVVDLFRLEIALDQAHGAAVEDVDRRVQIHAGTAARPHNRVKFRSSASPWAEDFSGCDCVPNTFPRPTIAANGSP